MKSTIQELIEQIISIDILLIGELKPQALRDTIEVEVSHNCGQPARKDDIATDLPEDRKKGSGLFWLAGLCHQHAELNGRVADYTYDDLYRLTQEDVTDATLGNRITYWTYDAVGNRLTETDVTSAGTTVTTYIYDSNDRLTSCSPSILDRVWT